LSRASQRLEIASTKKTPAKRRAAGPKESTSIPTTEATLAVLPVGHPPSVAQPEPNLLVTIPFDQAITIGPLFESVYASNQQRLLDGVRSHLIDAGVITANASVLFNRSTMAFEFSKNGIRGLQEGTLRLMRDSNGLEIPVLRNAAGRAVEQGRRVSMLASRAAALTAIVVSAAHMISGADIADKLRAVHRDVRFLVEARTNDKLGRLESIYAYTRELLAGPSSETATWELFRLTKEISEVRAQWRRDIHTKLREIEEPANKKGLFAWFRRTLCNGDEKDAQTLHSSTSEALRELHWVDFSLGLQYALSAAAGREQAFLSITLPDELANLTKLRAAVSEKTTFLREHGENLSARDFLDGIDALSQRYRSLSQKLVLPLLPSPRAETAPDEPTEF
jgi:hypothetical protein